MALLVGCAESHSMPDAGLPDVGVECSFLADPEGADESPADYPAQPTSVVGTRSRNTKVTPGVSPARMSTTRKSSSG